MIESGIILLDKPKGLSSFMAGKLVGRAVGASKFGHMGTLDPMATGLLVVAINKATKLFDKFLHSDKEYLATYNFGYETDTLDGEGEITKKNDVVVCKDSLEQVCEKFVGKQSQIPPIYSAKKINGKKAYELAREGKIVELKPKEVELYSLKLLGGGNNSYSFKINCSSGFYVRSLGRDIAKEFSTFATTTCIRRTQCSGFDLKDAQTLEEIKNGNFKLIPLEEIFV